MSNLLDQIDRVLAGTCPCGADPREGSAYCSADCEPTHIAVDTTSDRDGTPMRWRPDLVTAHDDAHLELFLWNPSPNNPDITRSWYTHRADNNVRHLRVDDGCRYVGADIPVDEMGEAFAARTDELWRRLERELGDTRRAVADPRNEAREREDAERSRLHREASEPICDWLRANNINPNSVPEWTPIDVTADTITLVMAIDDEWRIGPDGELLTEERTVPLLQPWTDARPLEDCLAVVNRRGRPADPGLIVVTQVRAELTTAQRQELAAAEARVRDRIASAISGCAESLSRAFPPAIENLRRSLEPIRRFERIEAESEHPMLRAIEQRRNRNTGPAQERRAPRTVNPRRAR